MTALAAVTALSAVMSTATATATASRENAVQQSLEVLIDEDEFTGALAAVRDRNGRNRNYTAGVADRDTNEQMPINSQLRIGSNTKMFTSIVVLQLVAEGKVKLDDPIETYLPNIIRGQAGDRREITIRQLLQHTSGLPDYVMPAMNNDFENYLSLQHTYFEPRQLVDFALPLPATTGWSYSNTNYAVAGLLIQRVTGRPVGEEITTRIINRANLHDTYWPSQGEQHIRDRHPKGYFTTKTGDLVDVSVQDPSMAWAAGALVSTPSDVNKFLTTLLNGKLLHQQELKEMQTTVTAPNFNTADDPRYGLGIATFTLSCGGTAWSHGGNTPGYTIVNAATTDDRAASIAITALPSTENAVKHLDAALDTALCK